MSYEGFDLKFTFDYQHGGDVWNGTQQVLNYYGRSNVTATERGRTNFVFDGVNLDGQINTTSVNFYDTSQPITQNRWVRYGFTGVDEEAIQDGSYLNLSNISLSKQFHRSYHSKFPAIECTIYGNNLWTWTRAKGINPYSSLFGNARQNAFFFFNNPLAAEVGLGLDIKF